MFGLFVRADALVGAKRCSPVMVWCASVVLSLTSVACATSTAQKKAADATVDAAFRTVRPQSAALPPLRVPVPTKVVLENGLTVMVLHKPGLPLIDIEVVVRSGSAADPRDRLGLANFTASMLKAGTTTRSSKAISEEIETRGATLGVRTDEDAIALNTTVLTENADPVLDIVADVLQHPAFDASEIQRVRQQVLTSLEQIKNDPTEAATAVFQDVVFGNHPYGHVMFGTRANVEKITRSDLQTFYAQHIHPANTAVIIVGDLTVEAATAAISKRLGGWKSTKGIVSAPPGPPAQDEAHVVVVDRPGAPQSQLRIGHLGVARNDPDYYALMMCNAVLGGLFNSRINMNLREDKGYTYGARSSFEFMRGPGAFVIGTAVRTDVTDASIREIIKEVAKIRQEDVKAEELEHAKSRYSLSLPGYFQTVQGIGRMVADIFLYDLPLDYYQQLPSHIQEVTVADVRRVAEQHLHESQMSIVVVGDRRMVEAGLTDLQRGPIAFRTMQNKSE